MNEEREKIRCRSCELVQWRDRDNCRRCGATLPEQVVKIVERVVEKVIVDKAPECLASLEQAQRLITEATQLLTKQAVAQTEPALLAQFSTEVPFPTMVDMERAMIVAAYRRSNRKPLEAARMLDIGKTTFYRKLRSLKLAA
ncbi:helix-turn-helix domain-containing protein [Acidicapsa dinghuensis]|uniref:Helix-turn-helix domain-containing protein n=1 Tax=Acidicapsa dinghuensis TaxID=2218256 RepID=A0ABW1ECG1_9BACT|nr:helix-turn-helix domain-containing protein [Acidicapsa dinghuensis]